MSEPYAANLKLTTSIALLRKSLQLSKSLHRAVMRQGSAILDKGTIRKLRSFRFAAVREGPDLRLFCNPAPLSRLALWLVDSTRDRWAEKENNRKAGLPFVIAVLNEVKKTFSVVGVTAALDYGDVRKK
jgi:cell division control protein 45